MGPFLSSLVLVLSGFLGSYVVAKSGVFDHVELDIGLEHYAEKAWIPSVSFMPLNMAVNLGYILVGVYWCRVTYNSIQQGMLKQRDLQLLYAFGIMSSVYGCVQGMRIYTQSVMWSILDQWLTFPFFALVVIWSIYLMKGWSSNRCALFILVSMVSYSLTLTFKLGFEIALGFHILNAIYFGVKAERVYRTKSSMNIISAAVASCLGFVVLKLLDFHLVYVSSFFMYVSGHFLSKLCDIGQIHCAISLLYSMTLQRAKRHRS